MKKMILISMTAILLAAGIVCAQQTAPAAPADKYESVAQYLRKALNVPSNYKIEIRENAETSVGTLLGLKVQFTAPQGSDTIDAWISEDSKTLLLGRTFDLSTDPYKKNWDKVNLENVPSRGAADAKVTVVEYTDFQCPFCSRAHNTVTELIPQYEGKVRWMYKSLPLNIHNWAEDAAVAGVCVWKQNNDAFWKVNDFFFKNQGSINKENLKTKVLEVATTEKLDSEALTKCIDNKETLSVVQADLKEAGALGFNSTPSFLVNGRPVVGAVSADEFRKVLDEAIASAQ